MLVGKFDHQALPVALVTGAARRVGAAISRCLSREGYAVVLHANGSIDEAVALATKLRDQGGKATAIAADLSDESGRDHLIKMAAECFGPLSLLVNNASVFHSDRLPDFSDAGFLTHMSINLLAPLRLSRDFAAQVPADSNASIVNVIDHRVLKLTPQFFTYTLSKAGLYTATTTMAQSLAPHVRVNAVGPGPTLPNIHEGEIGLEREAMGVPLEHTVDPDEIANAILYLARSKSVTGHMVPVDSGQHIGWRTPDVTGV